MSENEKDLLKDFAKYCSRHGKGNMFRAITFEELDRLNEMLNEYYLIYEQVNLDDNDLEEFLNVEPSAILCLYRFICELREKNKVV